MRHLKQALAWAALSTALYLLYCIWQEVRREGNETIVVVDSYGSDDEYYDRVYDRHVANGLARGQHADDPLLN